MGTYSPAVIVHDLAPYQFVHGEVDWLRKFRGSAQDHRRLIVCDTQPRELEPRAEHVDLELWRFARGEVLDRVSAAKVAALCDVDKSSVTRVLLALKRERDVYRR